MRDKLLRLTTCAKMLGLSVRQLSRETVSGKLAAIPFPGTRGIRYFYKESEIRRFQDERAAKLKESSHAQLD